MDVGLRCWVILLLLEYTDMGGKHFSREKPLTRNNKEETSGSVFVYVGAGGQLDKRFVDQSGGTKRGAPQMGDMI